MQSSSSVSEPGLRSRHGRFMRGMAWILLVTMMAGCYRTTPLTAAPEPGMRIAATLTPEGTAGMQNMLGPLVVNVEGVVTAVESDRWVLAMIATRTAAGAEAGWNRESVAFPTAWLGTTQRRELDRRKTWLSVGGAVAIVLLVGRTFVDGFLSGSDPDNGDVPPQ